ncbi:hypothetical protein V8E51_001421 [Hyaloscypha variabilis]
MDLRFAGDGALFGQPEVGICVSPDCCGLLLLPSLVPRAVALEILFDDIDAITTERYGSNVESDQSSNAAWAIRRLSTGPLDGLQVGNVMLLPQPNSSSISTPICQLRLSGRTHEAFLGEINQLCNENVNNCLVFIPRWR